MIISEVLLISWKVFDIFIYFFEFFGKSTRYNLRGSIPNRKHASIDLGLSNLVSLDEKSILSSEEKFLL